MEKTRAVIVDDDYNAIDLLKLTINENFPNIEIIALCNNVADAIKIINSNRPDLAFLDVELPDGYGFDIIPKVEFKDFDVIFITAYSKYAMNAFECSALHYLLKPVTLESLTKALERYKHLASLKETEKKLDLLKNNLTKSATRIMLPTGSGLDIFELDDIVRCEADDAYTVIYLKNKQYLIVTKHLNALEDVLSDYGFLRVHRKFIVNSKYIKKLKKSRKNPSLLLTDGAEVPISESRYENFLEAIQVLIRII